MATINYCDFTSGNDDTGDGSAGNPYKNIYKASTGLAGGDEVRCAKSPAHTLLSGNLTFTDGTTSITTAQDLTGVLSSKDFVGKNISSETWWEIESITSDTITLAAIYAGTSETTSAYKLGVTDTGTAATGAEIVQQPASDGTSLQSLLVISGGWNLTNEAQDGETWFFQSGANKYGYGIQMYTGGDSYIHLRDIGFCRYLNGIYFRTATGSSFTNISSLASGDSNFYCDTVTDITISNYETSQCYLNDSGIRLYRSTGNVVIDTMNSFTDSIAISTAYDCGSNRAVNATIMRSPTPIYVAGTLPYLQNITMVNCDIDIYYRSLSCLVIEGITTSAGGDPNVTFYSSHNSPDPLITCQGVNTAGNDMALYRHGILRHYTGDESRSGQSARFEPTSASEYIRMKLPIQVVNGTSLEVKFYIKKTADFNGDIRAIVYFLGNPACSYSAIDASTDYEEFSVSVPSYNISQSGAAELWVEARGTTGYVYMEDLSVVGKDTCGGNFCMWEGGFPTICAGIDGLYPYSGDVREGTVFSEESRVGELSPASVGDVEYGVAYGSGSIELNGTFVVPDEASVKSGETYGNASEFTGAFDADYPSAGDVQDGITFASGTYSGTFTSPSEDDVQSGVTYGNGSEYTGNFTEPGEANVKIGTSYGADGTEFTGTYSASCDYPSINDVIDNVSFNFDTETGNFVVPGQTNVSEGILYGVSGVQYVGSLDYSSSQSVTNLYNTLTDLSADFSLLALDSRISSLQTSINDTLGGMAVDLDSIDEEIKQLQLDIADIIDEVRGLS